MTCSELKQLLKIESEALREEIERDKYYQSEKVGHDIGWKEAEQHYMNTFLNNWAKGFKDCYCLQICKEEDCQYRRMRSVK